MMASDTRFPEFDIFVSYSSDDRPVADAVVSAHEVEGIRCWYAPRDIPPGADWANAITSAIHKCQLMVLIFSGNANHSQRVLDEVNYAISQGKPILPFRIENMEPTGAMGLHLSSRHWLDAYKPNWKAHIDRLVASVQANLGVESIESVQIHEPEPGEEVGSVFRETQARKSVLKRFGMIAAGVLVLAAMVFLGWSVFGDGSMLPVLSRNPAENPAQAADPIKVGLLMAYDTAYMGQFNQDVLEGIQRADDELGAVVETIETRHPEESMEFIDRFAEEDVDVIITAGFEFENMTAEAAGTYPDVQFVAIDQPGLLDQEYGNVTVLLYEFDKIGFLAGAFAGMLTESGSVTGLYSVESISPVVSGKEGFEAGVAYIDSSIEVKSTYYEGSYESSWEDSSWYEAEARTAVDNGADVVFAFAGQSGLSALEAAAEYPDVYCIGTEWDVWEVASGARSCLVTSVIRLDGTNIYEMIRLAQEGDLPPGLYTGEIGLAPYHDFEDEISPDIRERISEIRDKLVAGTIDTGVETELDALQQEGASASAGTQEAVAVEETITHADEAAMQVIIDYLEEKPPDFEDDFSTPREEWGSFQNAYGLEPDAGDYMQDISEVVYDGVLHVEGVPRGGDDTATDFPDDIEELFYAYNFGLEFNYEIENKLAGDNGWGGHGLIIRDGEKGHIGIEIDRDGGTALFGWDLSRNEIFQEGQIPDQTSGTLRVIAYGENIGVFLDGNLIMFQKDQQFDGINNMIRVQGEDYRLLIDDVRFWDLDEVQFDTAQESENTPDARALPEEIQNVLSYIEDMEPSFADDFSAPREEWGRSENAYGLDPDVEDFEQDISDVVYDGVLHVEGIPHNGDDFFTGYPHTELFLANNFVLEYRYEIENQPPGVGNLGSHGFSIRNGQFGLNFSLDDGGVATIYSEDWYETFHDIEAINGVDQTSATLRVIVYNDVVAFFFDNELMLTYDLPDRSGQWNQIKVEGQDYRLLIDDVRFWNLDGVELPAE